MSELKAYRFLGQDEVWPDATIGSDYYLKSEADKVITELKKACNDKDDWCFHILKELRHSNYKRCLAMAKICENKLGTVVKPGWWDKWWRRWLELAEHYRGEVYAKEEK